MKLQIPVAAIAKLSEIYIITNAPFLVHLVAALGIAIFKFRVSFVVEPVESTNLVRAVIRAVTRANTSVVSHLV